MTKQRMLLWIVITVLLAGMVLPAHAAPGPKEPAPKVGQKAGAITALLPIATISRGTGKAVVTNEAKKGDELWWNDLVKTQKGGRARITLTDQSILSLGAQSDLRIVKHDDRSQQTALQLVGGRMRAEVAKITRQGGSFELRTPTAVAGVIGTDFGSDASSVGITVFLCIAGIVQVANNDPNVPGSVQCAPGLTTSVSAGKPPTIPSNATPQQIQQLIQDTEPAIISAISPSSVSAGTTVDAAIGGSKLVAVNAVSVDGTGITATLSGAPTDTSVTVHMVIAANATPGPRTVTLRKPSGAASAAVFTVMQPPTAVQTGDLKKPYHDSFDQERQSTKAGLTALIASVQQAVDQTLQQLQTANQGNAVDLGPATTALNQQIAAIQNTINQAGGQVDQAVTSALATFDTQYTQAYNALLQRNPAGAPDDAFNQALQAAYNQVHASLGQAYANINGTLSGNVQAATSTVNQVQQTWMTTITAAGVAPPTPRVNNIERAIDLGAVFGTGILAAPDASSSAGSRGASVTRYAWVLCDSSYKPAQFGVPIAANAPGCNPLSGYASSNADFPFATCNLTPNDYIARVTVTDSNNQQAAMDVKIHVLPPTYSDPTARMAELATAYSNLQYTQFLSFFDQTAFSGYQTLSENVRTNFPKLASMNVHLNASQASFTCNDAKQRANWNLNYTFKQVCQTFLVGGTSVQSCSDPSVTYHQDEQLSVTMLRIPGKGWQIVDMQGDNGSLSNGASIPFPGPVAAPTDNSAPDLVVTATFPSYASGSGANALALPPGSQSVTAIVQNQGSAALTGNTDLQFNLQSGSGSLATTTVSVSGPIPTGGTVQVTGTISVPILAIGTEMSLVATVNPGCNTSPAESSCANNSSRQSLVLGSPIKMTQLTALNFLAGGPAQTLQLGVSDAATVSLNLPPGMTTSSPITQTLTAAGTLTWVIQATLNASAATPLAAMTVSTNFNFLPPQPISYTLTGPTFTEPATPALVAGGVAQALTVPVNVPGSYALTLPAGIATTSANPQTITNATGGTLIWNLQASLTTTTGAALVTPITAGAYTFNATYSVAGPTFTPGTTPSLLAGGPPQPLTVAVNIAGTFTLTLPAGITTTSPNPQTITTPAGGTLTWNLRANFTALTGTGLSMPVTIGPFSFNATYNNGPQANYIVQSVSFTGHTAPFTGAQGIQVGETLIINAVVANLGNGSPTGTITLTASCSGGPAGNTACSGTNFPTTTVPAPAAGTTVTGIITAGTDSFLPGTYTGAVTLTTAILQSAITDDSIIVPFDAVDFNLGMNPQFFPAQNVLVGGTAQMTVVLDETGNPTPFPMTITATTDNGGVPVTPASFTISPGSQTTTTSGSPGTAAPVTVVYSASNHGVTKNATQALNYVIASITSTSLFLNDASNPLGVQMGGTTSNSNPIVTLKLNSTPFGGTANPATITAPAPVGGFTSTVDDSSTTTAAEGGTFQLQVSAAFGATPTVTPLRVIAALPNSLPRAQVAYDLFVKAIGVPDLQVVSVTPPRTLNTPTPWLSGEGLDFTVVVRNNGNTASAGGEALTMMLNGYQVDNGAITVPALGPGATSAPILVHALAPNIDSSTFSGSAASLKTKVDADSVGDLNYANNTLTQNVATANWHLAVNGAGSADGTPLTISISSGGASWFNQALLQGTIDGGGTTALSFIPTAGVVSNKLSIADFAPATNPNSFLVTVSTGDNTIQNGFYVAQVIVQLMDGVTVTAQRQATIHVSVNNSFSSAPTYALGIVCLHGGARCDPGAGTPVPIQVNGALTEQYTVTVVPTCTPNPATGPTCQGTVDVVVTDGPNTDTSPPQVKGLAFNFATAFQLSANQDANGNIVTGAASGYAISLNGIQRAGATSPDAVGQSVAVPVNVGDISITANTGANSCTGVVPNGTPLQLTVTWNVLGGFNSPSVSWQWEDASHAPVGASPIGFTSPSGTSTFGGGTYTTLPTFTLTNTHAQDGLVGYFFAITVGNGITTATKYFPFYFDASVNQNFCGAVGGARGFSRVSGTWSRSAAGGGGPMASASRLGATSVDLRLSATDVSYTPSVPNYGDTVQVRFRARNEGTSDAKGVPIALLVNGAVVASDTFDVAAGRSALGGLQWNTAAASAATTPTRTAAVRPARSGRRGGNAAVADSATGDTPAATVGMARLHAVLVVDPQHTVPQKTTLEKTVPLAHFAMRSPSDTAIAAGGSQRILLEIQEGACAGLRLATGGVGPCGSADVELTIADVAKGTYMLNTVTGIADLGATFAGAPAVGGAGFSSELAGLAGHSYSVQVSGGRTALITIDSIRNPGQLDAATRAVFRNSAIRVMRGLGSDSGAAATGDVAGGIRGGPTVFVQLRVQVQ